MRRRLFFTLLCLAVAPGAQALGLLDAYQLAQRNDPAWLAAEPAREAGGAQRQIGRAALLPTLSWGYTTSRNQSEVSSQGNPSQARDYRSQAATLSLQQPLLDFEALARYRQGNAQATMAELQWQADRQALLARVVRLYSNALLAAQRSHLSRERKHALGERLALNQRLWDGGEGTHTDVLETQARLNLALAEQIEALDAQDAAERALQGILGQPVALQRLHALVDDFQPAPLLPAGFDAWQQLALQHNRQLAARQQGLAVAEQEVQRQRAGHLPKLGLYASSRQSRSESETTYQQAIDTHSVGLQLTVPLFAGGGVSAATRQASSRLAQARHELDGQTLETLDALRRHYNASRNGAARVQAYRLAADSAAAQVQATRNSLLGGERINLDVLDAEQQLFRARLQLREAQHASLLASVDLKAAAGILDEADLHEAAVHFRRGT
ncbi:type 1 secretion system outer membrane protein HasF [Pseudomonas sp. M47T1]|uniref:TolC family outer membrane protein n=1 Tax=Pseudomonas sp. M47T1 TaxID=1179778 RepID=UPI0002608618|nr:type 1 secretion system outer membrane protein HasF [Pseudomonas sp. M47T1]